MATGGKDTGRPEWGGTQPGKEPIAPRHGPPAPTRACSVCPNLSYSPPRTHACFYPPTLQRDAPRAFLRGDADVFSRSLGARRAVHAGAEAVAGNRGAVAEALQSERLALGAVH